MLGELLGPYEGSTVAFCTDIPCSAAVHNAIAVVLDDLNRCTPL